MNIKRENMPYLDILKKIFDNNFKRKTLSDKELAKEEYNQKSLEENQIIQNIQHDIESENDYFAFNGLQDDLIISAGDKILILACDKGMSGLWIGEGHYDPCTVSVNDGHKFMSEYVVRNIDELYNSLLYPLEDNVFLLNITDSTNRGYCRGYHKQYLYNSLIDIFLPIIQKFVRENSPNRHIGILISSGLDGTSASGVYLYNVLTERDDYKVDVIIIKYPEYFCAQECLVLFQEIKNKLTNRCQITEFDIPEHLKLDEIGTFKLNLILDYQKKRGNNEIE